MGQSSSTDRRESTDSQAPLNPGLSAEKVQETFYSSVNPFFTDKASTPPAAITRPAPPSRMFRVSELIDPYDLLGMTSDNIVSIPQDSKRPGPLGSNKQLPILVESPSGRTMDPQEFINNPDRPLAIRERQESILRAVEAARNASVGSTGTNMTFEQMRIEEGRLAYEKMKMKGRKGSKSGCGFFSGCFGGKS